MVIVPRPTLGPALSTQYMLAASILATCPYGGTITLFGELDQRHTVGGEERIHTQVVCPSSPHTMASHLLFSTPTMEDFLGSLQPPKKGAQADKCSSCPNPSILYWWPSLVQGQGDSCLSEQQEDFGVHPTPHVPLPHASTLLGYHKAGSVTLIS